jgi:hypothetical protein
MKKSYLLALLILGACEGSEPNLSSSVLNSSTHSVTWDRTLDSAVDSADQLDPSRPGVCSTSRCYALPLQIALPVGTFDAQHPGVEVSLSWDNEFDSLNLYVYRDQELIAKGEGIISKSHSVLLPKPENGAYTVYVAYDAADSVDVKVPFRASATVQIAPNPSPVRQLLPDLVYQPQRNVTFNLDMAYFEEAPPPGSSCYNSESAEDGAKNCLRFDQVMANVGEGDLEVQLWVPSEGSAVTEHATYQRIYYSDSTDHFDDVRSSDWEFHPVHQHYHVEDFAETNLWQLDQQGHRVGTEPLKVGHKISFCIADVEITTWDMATNRPRHYNAPDCLMPFKSTGAYDYYLQGLTRGWSDIYEYYLPGQYVDVDGVQDGRYELETVIDPDNHLQESDETNNSGSVLVELTGMGTANQHAAIVSH